MDAYAEEVATGVPMTNPRHAVVIERDPADTAIEDRFRRQAFVDSLIDLLFDRNNRQARGFVVGLTGPWGSGKRQVMLYVEAQLRKECLPPISPAGNASRNLARRLVVVRFNPWLHAGRDDVLRQFFRAIREEINKLGDPALPDLNPLMDRAKAFVHKYSGAFKAIPYVGTGVADATAAALAEKSLEAKKEDFVKSLRACGASVIVLIAEIDRLSNEEIREIAQSVKSVADFPMFFYLLAYDPDRVAKALGRDDTKLGDQYLEKIVQVQARRPRVDPKNLVDEIGRQIHPIVLDANGTAAVRREWTDAIHPLAGVYKIEVGLWDWPPRPTIFGAPHPSGEFRLLSGYKGFRGFARRAAPAVRSPG